MRGSCFTDAAVGGHRLLQARERRALLPRGRSSDPPPVLQPRPRSSGPEAGARGQEEGGWGSARMRRRSRQPRPAPGAVGVWRAPCPRREAGPGGGERREGAVRREGVRAGRQACGGRSDERTVGARGCEDGGAANAAGGGDPGGAPGPVRQLHEPGAGGRVLRDQLHPGAAGRGANGRA